MQTIKLNVGESVSLGTTLSGSGIGIVYGLDDTILDESATVDSNGVVTAVAVGTALVRARRLDGEILEEYLIKVS